MFSAAVTSYFHLATEVARPYMSIAAGHLRVAISILTPYATDVLILTLALLYITRKMNQGGADAIRIETAGAVNLIS